MRDCLLEFTVGNCRPMSTIEGRGFNRFLDAYADLVIVQSNANAATRAEFLLPTAQTLMVR
jgi:hypothetical protein